MVQGSLPSEAVPTPPGRRAALVEVVAATAVAGLGVLGIERLADAVPVVAGQAGALVAVWFVAVALVAGRIRPFPGDVLGLEGPPVRQGVALGLVASLVVLPVFAFGFDVWQTRVLGRERGAGPGLASPGLEFQGRPPVTAGRLVAYERAGGLALDNGTDRAVRVIPQCGKPDCARQLPPGGRLVVDGRASPQVRFEGADGATVRAQVGSGAVPMDSPLEVEPGLSWLVWLLLGQLAAVALPEEMFFRGYVLGRLRTCWTPRHRVLGVPFGLAHVGSALLFAAVHLFAVPEPQRLLVFFPGLLFAWLAERGRTVVAPAVHHALANAVLQILQRLYG